MLINNVIINVFLWVRHGKLKIMVCNEILGYVG